MTRMPTRPAFFFCALVCVIVLSGCGTSIDATPSKDTGGTNAEAQAQPSDETRPTGRSATAGVEVDEVYGEASLVDLATVSDVVVRGTVVGITTDVSVGEGNPNRYSLVSIDVIEVSKGPDVRRVEFAMITSLNGDAVSKQDWVVPSVGDSVLAFGLTIPDQFGQSGYVPTNSASVLLTDGGVVLSPPNDLPGAQQAIQIESVAKIENLVRDAISGPGR